MNIKKIISLGTLAFFLCFPLVSSAETVVRSGETVSINGDQRIEGDFYTAASIINLSGQVAEDITALGGRITINGKVDKDASLIGGSVDVHGPIGDDLRVVGGDVIIAEPVTGDVFVIGGTVTILSTASVGGDLVVYGGEVEVAGSVGGDIIGQVDTMRVDSQVKGNVDVTAKTLVLGDKTDVAGYVRYVSANELTRSPNAKTGEITRSDVREEDSRADVKAIIIPVLIVLFASLLWYLVARSLLVRITTRALTKSVRPAVTGFTAFFAVPIVVMVLLMTVLGSLVGVTALFAYVLAILLAIISTAAVLGTVLLQMYKKTTVPLSPFVIATGVGAMLVIALLPIAGPMILGVLFIITFGALVDIVLHP